MDTGISHFLVSAGQVVLVAAIAFVTLCVVTSRVRFQMMTERADGGSLAPGEMEPMVAARIAEGRPFLLLCLRPGAAEGAADVPEESWTALEQRLRAMVRRGDAMTRVGGEGIFLLVEAPAAAAAAIWNRLEEGVRREPARSAAPPAAIPALQGGLAAWPDDGRRALELLKRARAGARPAPVPGDAAVPAPPAPSEVLDERTGVLRAEQLALSLPRFLARLRRDDQPMSVVWFDIDQFRRYNEQYGEAVGDRLLRGLSEMLQRETRADDLILRGEGGDEFVLALPETAEGAAAVARRLVAQVRRVDLSDRGVVRISVTAGVAAWPEHGAGVPELLAAARAAVRTARKRGRGTWALAEARPAPSKADRDEERDVF